MTRDRIAQIRAAFLDDPGDEPMPARLVADILDALDALYVAQQRVIDLERNVAFYVRELEDARRLA